MSIKVRIPAPMRQHTGGKKEVETDGDTVEAVLEDLCRRFPGLKDRLFDGGQVRRFVNFTLNNEDVRYLNNLATPTKSGDELDVMTESGPQPSRDLERSLRGRLRLQRRAHQHGDVCESCAE